MTSRFSLCCLKMWLWVSASGKGVRISSLVLSAPLQSLRMRKGHEKSRVTPDTGTREGNQPCFAEISSLGCVLTFPELELQTPVESVPSEWPEQVGQGPPDHSFKFIHSFTHLSPLTNHSIPWVLPRQVIRSDFSGFWWGPERWE